MNSKRILVIDDEEDLREALTDALEPSGYTVDCAADGREALALSAANQYDIAFFDYRLPDTNGIELCKKMEMPGTVKVFMSGSFDGNVLEREIAFEDAGGETHYLYKPFMRGEVLAIVAKILARAKGDT